MLTFPKGTEFGRRLPKQKFYEHLDVSSEVKRLFVEQVRLITWANKLSPQTMNLADGQMQLTIAFKEAALTGDNAFRLRQRYATGWLAPEELSLEWAVLDMDGLYESIVRQIAGDAIAAPQAESLKEAVEQTQEREKLEKQIAALKAKMKKEKQLNKQMELRREIQVITERVKG